MFKKWNSKGYKYVKSVWGKNSKNLFTRNYWFLCQNNCSWICFEKKTKEYAAVHYRHIHDAFAIFCQQSFERKIFQKTFVAGYFHLNFTRSFISMFNSKSSSLLQDAKVPYRIYRFQGGFKVVICLGKYTSPVTRLVFFIKLAPQIICFNSLRNYTQNCVKKQHIKYSHQNFCDHL